MLGVPSVAGRPFGSDRSRGRVGPARGYPIVHDPGPRPLFVLLFVLHGNRYTCFLIHAKKGPPELSSPHLPAVAKPLGLRSCRSGETPDGPVMPLGVIGSFACRTPDVGK